MAVSLTVNKSGYRQMLIMFRHFGANERARCIERIHRLNENLSMIVNGSLPLGAVENKLREGVAGHYQRVRSHASALYGTLKERFQTLSCSCKVCTTLLTYSTTQTHY